MYTTSEQRKTQLNSSAGVKMDRSKELAEARIKFHMEPDELIALVKEIRHSMRGT